MFFTSCLRIMILLMVMAACTPDPAKPVNVEVLDYDFNAGIYKPRVVQLTRLKHLVNLEGDVAQIKSGAQIVINEYNMFLDDANQAAQSILQDPGKEAKATFFESDGVWIPADFDSLNITTIYYNLERSFKFFGDISGLGIDSFIKEFGARDAYYFPVCQINNSIIENNAFYLSILQGYMFLPFDKSQGIPFSINGGIIGHEFGHSVFNFRVHQKALIPAVNGVWNNRFTANPGFNLLDSLEEGAADFFGLGITCSYPDFENCDPRFMGRTIDGDDASVRTMDEQHCLTDNNENDLKTLSNDDFRNGCKVGCNYVIGSVFASALWRAASDDDLISSVKSKGAARRLVFEALYRAEGGSDKNNINWADLVEKSIYQQNLFSLRSGDYDSVLDAVVDAAGDNNQLKAALCRAFIDRFKFDVSDIRKCSGVSLDHYYNECKQ